METAVYSGSFNPLHIGHLSVLRSLVELYDRVLLVVSPVNPLKAGATALDAASRLKSAQEAVGRHPELKDKVEVSDIEFRLPLPNYTIDTLDALSSDCAMGDVDGKPMQENFTLVVGGDQIADFRRWKCYGRILTDYGVAVFPREGFDITKIKNDLLAENSNYRIRLIDMPLVTVSSTQIRQGIAAGEDVSMLLM